MLVSKGPTNAKKQRYVIKEYEKKFNSMFQFYTALIDCLPWKVENLVPLTSLYLPLLPWPIFVSKVFLFFKVCCFSILFPNHNFYSHFTLVLCLNGFIAILINLYFSMWITASIFLSFFLFAVFVSSLDCLYFMDWCFSKVCNLSTKRGHFRE